MSEPGSPKLGAPVKSAAERALHIAAKALADIVDGPLTIAASPDVVSAVEDYRDLIRDQASRALERVRTLVPSAGEN